MNAKESLVGGLNYDNVAYETVYWSIGLLCNGNGCAPN